MSRSERQLADATWPEVASGGILLVPVGSLEQHGPHLPLDTDAVIAQAVAGEVAERLVGLGGPADERAGVWVAPPVVYGSSGEHQGFPGTVSIGSEVLRVTLLELVRSARTWAARVVVVNGHGGNVHALSAAVEQLRCEGHDAEWHPCRTEEVDLHAGRTETSLMLHLQPWRVRLHLAEPGDLRPLPQILPLMVASGVRAVSENGVLGDPTGASAAEGRAVLLEMADHVLRAVMAEGVAR
ncbi:mycofactocin biosynthesis peptidyl-dipeptidase MftE [Nocardioides sp. TRM66260-LWL]|uniref:mycofactocin biosynthesis peptidyl-dipeptidase MftE n=1 Tax=Nocardioides sp. TRM66260-LWL TaxID=2874478 RepID=UPI001CC5ED13|nr:mycofactocin biosynthesis peptidyl-dipeptidase MftE [Nocardioides sp. TRM66260-LWL]MBZ5735334.1 mycofactocin biosynthesis peptidyl-dipeptidase MftE [Nocardioides sp. TRM66260-LWL]